MAFFPPKKANKRGSMAGGLRGLEATAKKGVEGEGRARAKRRESNDDLKDFI